MKKLQFLILLLITLSVLMGFTGKLNKQRSTVLQAVSSSRVETFTFLSNGKNIKGKIYLPAAFETNKNLPAIFLIDFTETHFKIVTDEFEQVINGVEQIKGLDALVVSLDGIPDIDAEPETFVAHYKLFKDMVFFVDGKYTNNSSRTFIGKGSEGGVVITALFAEYSENPVFENFIATDPSGLYGTQIINLIENKDFPKNKNKLKLHFSFTKSNDRQKCNRIIALFENANYTWLQFESVEYTNSTYDNTYPISFAEGLKFVFDDY